MIKVNIDIKATFKNLCVNIDCDIFMTNRCYVAKMISNFKFFIKAITSSKVREIENTIVFFTKYITLNFDFSKIIDKQSIIVKIFEDVHIVNDFSTKIFIEINIIELERIITKVNTLIINNCQNFKINSFAISHDVSINKIAMYITAITMLADINMKVSTMLRNQIKLSKRDYMFHLNQISRLELKEKVFLHIIDAEFFKVVATNSTNDAINLIKRSRLKVVKEFEKNDCFTIFEYDLYFVAKNSKNDDFKFKIKILMTNSLFVTIDHNTIKSEIVIDIDIIIFDIANAQSVLKQVIQIYSIL